MSALAGTVFALNFSDTFQSYALGVWSEGATVGGWNVAFNGYGFSGIEKEGNNRVFYQKPQASVSSGETHAALLLSTNSFTNPDFAVSSKIVQQLRTPTPNAWEVPWMYLNYTDNYHFYYFTLKKNGWELGKEDNTKLDPLGVDCVWPSLLNCKYPGAQRFLATGSSPSAAVGTWYTTRMVSNNGVISAYVNGNLITSFTDTDNPYSSGKVGLYNEDAYVRFDNVSINY